MEVRATTIIGGSNFETANAQFGQIELLANTAFARANAANTSLKTAGVHSIWLPAQAWVPESTTEPTKHVTYYYGTINHFAASWYVFDEAIQENIYTHVMMPAKWNGGNVKVRLVLAQHQQATAYTSLWSIRGTRANPWNAENFNHINWVNVTAFTSVTATTPSSNTLYITDVSSNVFISEGTYRKGNTMLILRIQRRQEQADDTMDVGARLYGVEILYDTTQGNDVV